MCLQDKSFENNVGELGEIAYNEHFLLFPQCFHLSGKCSVSYIKIKIVVCKLFQFGTV